MALTKLTFLSLAIFYLCNVVNAQVSFKKIEYASFDVNSPRTKQKDSVAIFLYTSIDMNGLSHVSNRDEESDSILFFKFQLDPTQLKKTKAFFTDKTALQDYMVTKSLKDGEHYGGSYDFLLVTYANDKKDSICFIDDYMSSDFENVFTTLKSNFYRQKTTNTTDSFVIPQDFKKSVQISFNHSNYLPPIEFPPPPM